MTSPSIRALSDPERRLALTYARPGARAALHALWALDEQFGRVLVSTREAGIGAMRLTWWREALIALDDRPPPAEPLLSALAADVMPHGITGAALAAMEEGWYALLEANPPGHTQIGRHAEDRGARLFALSAIVLGQPGAPVAEAGRRWACADLLRRLSDRKARAAARAIGGATGQSPPKGLRPLSALALLADRDLAADRPEPRAAPRRVLRLALHGLTGL